MCSHLSACLDKEGSILRSILTHHSYRYDAVKEVELNFLIENWEAAKASEGFKSAMAGVVNGAYPHAQTLLADIFERVGNRGQK